MHTLIRTALALLLTTAAFNAHADLKQLGFDFRTMMANYTIINTMQNHCPELTPPEIIARSALEKQMQNKLGLQNHIQLMMKINKSDDKKNARATADKLWEMLDGCDDPELNAAMGRIKTAHDNAYQRFESEPGLVKPKDVPVPMRRQ
ncbi:hypothetical protein [Gilvimarinus polysaccharolyticus]|uniref:hypothetical protein n=1 Tax=Gilvimarinus polysaccharolyticus TaxID=863921 RepID=UPI0006739D99|nr:hypothetical protein [Gilvimarinus polysaccharolyticus]